MIRTKVKRGDEMWVFLPEGKLAEVDEARGQYFTRNKFVLWALDRAMEEVRTGTVRIEKTVPQGAVVQATPSGLVSSNSDTTPNALRKESLANVR